MTTNIKLVEIDKAGVGKPRNDGSRGSSLYRVPIKLSERAPAEWGDLFVEAWDHPQSFGTMHRPGIASVVGDTVVLNGTTVEEVGQHHQAVLEAAAQRANEGYDRLLAQRQEEEARRRHEEEEHRKRVDEAADRIKFTK